MEKACGTALRHDSAFQTRDGEKWKHLLPALTGQQLRFDFLSSVAQNDVRLAAEEEKYLEEPVVYRNVWDDSGWGN